MEAHEERGDLLHTMTSMTSETPSPALTFFSAFSVSIWYFFPLTYKTLICQLAVEDLKLKVG